jgi:hypothetical protein
MHYISLYTLMLLAAPHALDSPPYIYPNLACASLFLEKEKESTKLFGYPFLFSFSLCSLFFFKGIDRIRRRRRRRRSREYNTARQRLHIISTHTF